MNISIARSTRKGKKWTARIERDGRVKTVHFGGAGFADFTSHGDEARRERYLARHKKREKWDDLTTAGALSRWLLWNKPTLEGSARDAARRFGATITLSSQSVSPGSAPR